MSPRTWTGFDAALKRSDRIVRSDDAADRTITAVDQRGKTLTAANHGFQTGDAVVYRATVVDPSPVGKKETKPIVNLKDDVTYFVIVDPNDANKATTFKLAATRDDAFANRPITPGAIDTTGTGNKVSRATLFTGFQGLAGGTMDDTIGLTMQTIDGFDVNALAIDGGAGTQHAAGDPGCRHEGRQLGWMSWCGP